MGKSISLLILVCVLGIFVYRTFHAPANTSTPDGTAHAFVKAAMDNDADKVRSLCMAGAAASAVEVAAKLRSLSPDVYAFTFQAMKPSSVEAEAGLTAAFSGQILALEFKREGKECRILSVAISEQ